VEWDIKRLGASLILAARDRDFSKTAANQAARAAAASYRERMTEFAEMKVLDAWYATVSIDAVKEHFRNDQDMSARLSRKQRQARSQNSEAVIPKLTEVVNGVRKIKNNPPVISRNMLRMSRRGTQNLSSSTRSHCRRIDNN
jgi:hypothetical protein